MQSNKLLPPSPPYGDQTDPRYVAWQLDQHAQAINHLSDTKMDKPSASLVRLMGVALSAILGLFGLVSPEKSAEVLKLLLQ